MQTVSSLHVCYKVGVSSFRDFSVARRYYIILLVFDGIFFFFFHSAVKIPVTFSKNAVKAGVHDVCAPLLHPSTFYYTGPSLDEAL